MNAEHHDLGVSQVAAAIAEPARTRMLCALMDGHARTSTELASIAEVSASTASAHLAKLKQMAWCACMSRAVIVITAWPIRASPRLSRR